MKLAPVDRPRPGWAGGLRIVGAIALKDMLEALRNHVTLGIMLGATLLVLSGLGLPRLLAGRGVPTAVVFDPSGSGLVQAWAGREDLQAIEVESQAELERVVVEASQPALGLALPSSFVLSVETDEALALDGYAAHWVDDAQLARQVGFFEAELSQAAGRTVVITTAGHKTYPTPQSGGQTSLYAMHLALQLLIVGIAVVPYLLVEEKEARTLDALLVSPAGHAQVVAGKAVAGAAYCLLGGAVVIGFLNRWIVHWDLALLSVLLGTLVAVGVGLLGGALAENAQVAGLGMTTLVVILLAPALLGVEVISGLPAWAQAAVPCFPTVALVSLIRASLAGDLSGAPIGSHVVVLIVSAAIAYALVVWRVRRAGR
jgi:ABC-2 type transport system permease protein